MRIYKIETNGNCFFKDIEPTFDNLQAEVGGMIESVGDPWGSYHAYINEEGKLLNMDDNPTATRFAHVSDWIGTLDYIVGPMIIMGHLEGDKATECPEEVARDVQRAFGAKY